MEELLKIEGLTKTFGGLAAVNQIDLQVNKGELVGVIGPNGSGKTTFFNLLSGFFPPSKGRIFFKNKNIVSLPAHKRVGLGIIRTFQLVSVFNSLTVWENLVLSANNFTDKKHKTSGFFFTQACKPEFYQNCLSALEIVGLSDRTHQRVSTLSYGEKRLLEIAIGLSLNPRLFLLDEPFSGLSDYEIGQVLDILHRVKEKFTLVIIEHKLSKLMDLIQRLVVINYGELICQGDPETVICDSKVRECYWGKDDKTCSL